MMYALFLAAQAAEGERHLTPSRFLQDLPLDPASLFTLALAAVGVGWVVWAGTRTRDKSGNG